MKKFTCVLLVFCLLFSLSIQAYAEDLPTLSCGNHSLSSLPAVSVDIGLIPLIVHQQQCSECHWYVYDLSLFGCTYSFESAVPLSSATLSLYVAAWIKDKFGDNATLGSRDPGGECSEGVGAGRLQGTGYVGTGTPIISKDGGVNEVIETVKINSISGVNSLTVDVGVPGNYGYVSTSTTTYNFRPVISTILTHDVDGTYTWIDQEMPSCSVYNSSGVETLVTFKSGWTTYQDPGMVSYNSFLLSANSCLYVYFTSTVEGRYKGVYYHIPAFKYKFTPFLSNGTIVNNTNITINNNTYIGNIYTDNSTNITYIYPDDGSGTISDTPILYDNTTNEYITYDNTTNNYYYITYVTPEPTPTPDPDAPVATPGPDDPAATPDPDAVYNVNVLSVGEWFSDFVLELKGFFNTLGVGIAAGLADLDANFTLAIENLNLTLSNAIDQLSINFNLAIENLSLNIKNYFIGSGLMPDPDAEPTPTPVPVPSPSPSPTPVPSPSPTPVPSPDPDEDEVVNSTFLEWLQHVIHGINAALGPVQEVGGTFVDFYGMLPMEVRATLTGALCILLAAGMWKFFGG